jgi:hypothetical protein
VRGTGAKLRGSSGYPSVRCTGESGNTSLVEAFDSI